MSGNCVGLHPYGPCPPGVGCNAAPDPVGLRVAELEAEVAEQARIIQALEDELAEAAALRAVAAAARTHLAEVDNQPAVPEPGGTIGMLREALEELTELEDS